MYNSLMRVDEFYQSRKGDWETLSKLIDQCQRDMRGLSETQVRDMARLYRAATSDLALAQRDFGRSEVTVYLNQLVGRAHAVVYRSEPLALKRFWQFATVSFPRLFRETWIFTFVAALFFILPGIVSGVVTYLRPESATLLLPPQTHSLITTVEHKELWIDIPVEERPYTAAFIMRNNIQVSFLAFASGLTAGLLTLWVLFFNGLMIGTLTGLTAYYGIGFELWTFVIGHGVIELTIIFIAGGSGLMLGWAIIHPGLMRRRDALSQAARKAVYLLLGAVPWLVVAGTIEGFISPNNDIAVPLHWAVGIVSGIILYSYLLLAGREKKKTKKQLAANFAN
ncbi:MAG: stage II sporulation protein M [Chloroflexota bacterium]|nr:stage II sporulation protein M [Anaerolineales bacterium]